MSNCSNPDEWMWNVSRSRLHNLSSWCAPNYEDDPSLYDALISPATFFTQLFRFSFSLTLLTLATALYNCINVLSRNLLSTATCSLYWVFFFFFVAFKAGLLMVLVPVSHHPNNTLNPDDVNTVGFVTTSLLQILTTLTLVLALDHERRFRSPDNASIDDPTARCCVGQKLSHLVCSYWRVAVCFIFLLPLISLIIMEALIDANHNHTVHTGLVLGYVASLLITRSVVIVSVVHIILFTKGNSDPTIVAKLYLVAGCVLSLLEDLPNSVLTMKLNDMCACYLGIMSLYDFFQIIGGFSLIFYGLFIRSQYLRIEQECKLVLVWDMQKLLQVNGRKDIVKYS